METEEYPPELESVSGLMISLVALVRALERNGTLAEGEYRGILEAWIDGLPAEKKSFVRYEVMRLLMKRLEPDPIARH